MSCEPNKDPAAPLWCETNDKWSVSNWQDCELCDDDIDHIIDDVQAHAYIQTDEFEPIVNRIFDAIIAFAPQDDINRLLDQMIDQVREEALKDLQSGWYVLKQSAFLKEQAE